MKTPGRLVGLCCLRLYPARWRARYGWELEALLESRSISLRDCLDLLRGALDARLHPEMLDVQEGDMRRNKSDRSCSFCSKAHEKVARLIAGPGGVYICNECIALCNRILAEHPGPHEGYVGSERAQPSESQPAPEGALFKRIVAKPKPL